MLRRLMTPKTLMMFYSPIMRGLRNRYDELDEETYDRLVQMAIDDLLDGTDGPTTNFVVVSRAIELAREDRYSGCYQCHDIIGNALAAVLGNRGVSM